MGSFFLPTLFFIHFFPIWSKNNEGWGTLIAVSSLFIVLFCTTLGNKFFHTKQAAAEYLIEIGCDDYEGLKKAPGRQGLYDTYYCQDVDLSARFFIFYKEKKGVYGIKKYDEFYYGD